MGAETPASPVISFLLANKICFRRMLCNYEYFVDGRAEASELLLHPRQLQ